MALRILCAGCAKDEKEEAESAVRRALAEAAAKDDWTVSLVKLGGQWSVTLDAPKAGVRAKTLVAPSSGLTAAIREILRPGGAPEAAPSAPSPSGGAAPSPAPPPPAAISASGEEAGDFTCVSCQRGFVVLYEGVPDEGLEDAPAACPHCWHTNRVLIGAGAAATREYRTEKR